MEFRNIGGVLIAAGLICLIFFGVSFIYWASSTGAAVTKLLLLTGVVALSAGSIIFAAGRRK